MPVVADVSDDETEPIWVCRPVVVVVSPAMRCAGGP